MRQIDAVVINNIRYLSVVAVGADAEQPISGRLQPEQTRLAILVRDPDPAARGRRTLNAVNRLQVAATIVDRRALLRSQLGDLQLQTKIREHVAFVLELCDGNRSEAAKLLGLHRRTLQRFLQSDAPKYLSRKRID